MTEENKNILEGAKFRDAFLTRDGRVAIYISKILCWSFECHRIIIQDEFLDKYYNDEGKVLYALHPQGTQSAFEIDSSVNEDESIFDIVSRYQEHIDESDLDEIAEKLYQEEAERNLWEADKESFFCGVKACYHKVKDE